MRSLYTRIYLHLLGMLMVVALVSTVIFATGFRRAYFRTFTQRLVQHEAAELSHRWGDPAARDETARRLAADLELDLTVRDAEGRTVVVAGAEALPPLNADEERAAREGTTVFTHGRRGWYAVAPIVDPATRAVRGTVQAAPIGRASAPSLWRPALVLLLALLIVAGATAPLARRISRPVERLTVAMRRFGGGDLGYRVRLPAARWRQRHVTARLDELGALTTSWNDMADRIERLVRGEKELLANVSHELRSPLSRIRVALELLPRDAESEARIRDLEGDLGELERLIDDVLTASRLEAAGLPARLEAVSVPALFAQLVERARIDPATAGREVRTECPPALPLLIADGALLKRALWNLIENAAKYGAPPITLSVEIREGRAALRVRDEGAGISPADRARVFDPFYRADKARTPSAPGEIPRGFGMGLTIARRVAEVHGGSIRVGPARVDNGGERGCEIVLELPERAEAASA